VLFWLSVRERAEGEGVLTFRSPKKGYADGLLLESTSFSLDRELIPGSTAWPRSSGGSGKRFPFPGEIIQRLFGSACYREQVATEPECLSAAARQQSQMGG
jgi:hypothetical protein